jgi:hypothetical protein
MTTDEITLSAALAVRCIRHEPATTYGKRRLYGPDGADMGAFDAWEAWERIVPAYPVLIKVERCFAPADRYAFDFRHCSSANGWAQLDTSQDASYFGNWLNPVTRQLVSYCEGDVTVTTCATDGAFVAEVHRVCAFYADRDEKRPGIDPGFNSALKESFAKRLGLAEWLH